MPNKKEYDWTSVWVLASIHLAQDRTHDKAPESYRKKHFAESLKRYKNLYDIIYMGDFFNHAIFTHNELTDGIKRLTDRGLIREEDGFLLTTEKFEQSYKNATKEMEELTGNDILKVVAGILKTKLPWE
ncbi:MAG: hypothetical protein ACTSRE_14505 [Promethearchaeota archaeon]